MFLRCEKCKKKMIKRLPNGMLRFEFGALRANGKRPVVMEIFGSIKMQCLREDCMHMNVFTFFPPPTFEGKKNDTGNNI